MNKQKGKSTSTEWKWGLGEKALVLVNWKEGSAIQENKQFQKVKQLGAIGDEFHLSWWGVCGR